MTRQAFSHQLRDLQDETLVMGSMVEKAIARAVESLNRRDFDLAEQVCQDDEKINQKRFEIEETCVKLIAKQQPMAGDLRTILSVLSIVTDLERMGDYASGVAEISLLLRDDPPCRPLVDIPAMANIGSEMLRESLRAFVDKDERKARDIAERDDEIDSIYHKVLQQCIALMTEDSAFVAIGTRIIWVAHKLERIGDRATNICERVVFAVTGRMEEMSAL
ncbi:MAG: phosphate signaling complex protein PhoU [Dehalococcoidia bacterium]